MVKRPFIGFPPPLLGPRPLRLEVLFNSGNFLVLNKPAGIPISMHSWERGKQTLCDGINTQAQSGKGELRRLGISRVRPFIPVESEISGLAPLLKTGGNSTHFKNLFGSGKMNLVFRFLTRRRTELSEFDCDLPIAPHLHHKEMVVSHQTGKATQTQFRQVEKVGGFTMWEAETRFYRYHQIRLHALECGIPIVGESLYAKEHPVFLSDLKRDYRTRKEEKALYSGLCLHFFSLTFSDLTGNTQVVKGDFPSKFQVLLKKLSLLPARESREPLNGV